MSVAGPPQSRALKIKIPDEHYLMRHPRIVSISVPVYLAKTATLPGIETARGYVDVLGFDLKLLKIVLPRPSDHVPKELCTDP
jgi:hypothetical protein